MIPNVLHNLINKYNEKGVYLLRQNAIYWYNALRWEKMCDVPLLLKASEFIYTNSQFYHIENKNMQSFKSKQWSTTYEFISLTDYMCVTFLKSAYLTPFFSTYLNDFYEFKVLNDELIGRKCFGDWRYRMVDNQILPTCKFPFDYCWFFEWNDHFYFISETLEIRKFNLINDVWI